MAAEITRVLQQLTLEEKAALCTGASPWETVAVERLGIPAITVSDGPHGVRRTPGMATASLPATCFPTASALAATWDPDLIYALGQAIAEECIALGVDIILGPGNNMKRTPLCGRNFEYFSEDPFLGGTLAARYIQGVQSRGVGTALKHFAANNQEFQRMAIDAQIDERALREIYLAGFERAVTLGRPWMVMCAYNRLNGEHCSQNRRLLTEILKDEWGFEGAVVSDWGAVHDRVAALRAGLELEMPGPQARRVERVIEAVRSGALDPATLDDAVARLLRIVFRARQTPKGHTALAIDEHHALARRIAAEAIVLLKNEQGLLPLGTVQRLAVIGAAAREPYFQGGGSSHVTPTRVDNPLDELRKRAPGAELRFAPGYTMEEGFDQSLIDEAVAVAAQAEVALLFIALPPYKESEGYDRSDIDLTSQQIALIKAVCARQPNSAVILNNGSAIALREWIEGPAAVLEAWLPGQAGAGAIVDVLFGDVNPSGRLAETFPLKLSDTPAYLNYPGENGQVRYGEGLFIGYRYYDAREQRVQFPFGYGLSYTTFDYRNLRVSQETFRAGESLDVLVDVTNTGAHAGKTTVQVYVRDPESTLVRPPKELKGFAKVALEPGQTLTVTITLEPRAFMYYHPLHQQWIAENGAFDILIGDSATDIRLKHTVRLEAAPALPVLLTRDSTVREWLDHPRGAALLRPLLESVRAQLAAAGADAALPDWGQDLPLDALLMFWGGDLPAAPEEIVGQLLAQLGA